MTLTVKFNNQQQIDEVKAYMKDVYEYIDLDKEHIPATIETYDNEISIYMTDAFFRYSYQFFMDRRIIGLSGTKKEELEKMARDFREGSEEFLMSLITL